MNRTLLLVCFFAGMIAASRQASAQWGDPMAEIQELQRQTTARMDQINAQNQQFAQQADQHRQQMIQNWRQQTGDWQTPDNVVYQQMENEYFSQNPGAWAAKQEEDRLLAQGYQQLHQQRMNDIQYHGRAHSEAIADAANYVNQLSMQGFQNRMDSMDVTQHNNINAINERGDWINPQTGAVTNLSYHHNQVQQVDGQTWYTDNYGNQYLMNQGGYGGYGDW